MLSGFYITPVSSIQEAEEHLRNAEGLHPPLDFIIMDDQSESRVDDFVHLLQSLSFEVLKDTKVIHLFTPTTDNLSVTPMLRSDMGTGIVRVTKPPRHARLLQTLAGLKNLHHFPATPIISASDLREEEALARRTLFGNVLVAEGQRPLRNLHFFLSLTTIQIILSRRNSL